MSAFVENVLSILEKKKITKNKMLTDLHLSKNSFVDWKKRGTIPSASVVSAIAEYLGTTISELMGYPEDEEELVSFPSKLSYQLTATGLSIPDLANRIRVPENEILGWIEGKSKTYSLYYQQLSDFFQVAERYWTSPGMISPGIEPTTDEYLLILLYRRYRETGVMDEDSYGKLSDYFPGTPHGSPAFKNADSEWLSLIHQLPPDAQLEFRGEIKGYLKRLNEEQESVAAEPPRRKAK